MSAAPRVEPIVLQEPQCVVGCRTCLLECAIMPERLAWWHGEIERLYRERALAADRRLYDAPLRIADTGALARMTTGMSPADIANVVNKAASRAAEAHAERVRGRRPCSPRWRCRPAT
eukprot:gene29775-39493_t